MKKALYKRSEDPLQWFSSKMGLSFNISLSSGARMELAAEVGAEKQEWVVAIQVSPACDSHGQCAMYLHMTVCSSAEPFEDAVRNRSNRNEYGYEQQ